MSGCLNVLPARRPSFGGVPGGDRVHEAKGSHFCQVGARIPNRCYNTPGAHVVQTRSLLLCAHDSYTDVEPLVVAKGFSRDILQVLTLA